MSVSLGRGVYSMFHALEGGTGSQKARRAHLPGHSGQAPRGGGGGGCPLPHPLLRARLHGPPLSHTRPQRVSHSFGGTIGSSWLPPPSAYPDPCHSSRHTLSLGQWDAIPWQNMHISVYVFLSPSLGGNKGGV